MTSRYSLILFLTVIMLSSQKYFMGHSQPRNQKDELIEVSINIVIKCLGDHTAENILASNWTNDENIFLQKILNSLSPVQLVGSYNKAIQQKYRKSRLIRVHDEFTASFNNRPGKNFVIPTTSSIALSTCLRSLKRSIWWNHRGFFLVVDKNIHSGCKIAPLLLHQLWTYNILSGIVICYDPKDKLKLYTFNPYNDFAPNAWNKIRGFENEHLWNKNRWTLFQQAVFLTNVSYPTLCESLIFDKTTKLNGHVINMGAYVHANLLTYDVEQRGLDKFGGVNGDIVRTICSHLNASAYVKFYGEMGSIDDYGFRRGFLRDLQSNEIDFAMNMNILRSTWRQQTYPHETTGFCIVSRKNPVTLKTKFRLTFDGTVWKLLGACMVTTMIIQRYCAGKGLVEAALVSVQTLLSIAGQQERGARGARGAGPWSRRLLLLSTLGTSAWVTIIFQTQLSSSVVAPGESAAIDGLAELLASGLALLGTLRCGELLGQGRCRLLGPGGYRLADLPGCVARLLGRRQRLACLAGCTEARLQLYDGPDFHISEPVGRSPMAFSARPDWPLLPGFDRLLRRLAEAGVLRLFRRREAALFKHGPGRGGQPHRLRLDSLEFGFAVAACGWAAALVAFLLELLFRAALAALSRRRRGRRAAL